MMMPRREDMKRRNLYLALAILLSLVLVVGCAAAPAQEPSMAPVAYDMMEMEAEKVEEYGGERAASAVADIDNGSGTGIERLIIRNASLEIVVADTDDVVDEIGTLAGEFDGYIVDSNRYTYDEGSRATVTFRIPVESLDEVLDRIRTMATEVRSESISGQDVTEEYVDLESRLRHLESTEARLEEFLEDAEDTEAALAVYEQLQYVQADIEQVKGRMKYLEDSAAMSSVTVNITPDALAQPIEVGRWHPEGTLKDAFESLIEVMQFLVDAAIYIIVLILPVLVAISIPIVIVVLILRALFRGRKRRKARRMTVAEATVAEATVTEAAATEAAAAKAAANGTSEDEIETADAEAK
jgi:hypothetical protein